MTDKLSASRLAELWDFGDPELSVERFRAATAAGPVEAAELATQLARALGLAGRRADAEAVLDGVAVVAPVVGVRVALERGRLRNSAGESAEAVPWFEAALDQAIAAGEEDLAVDAAHMLAIADAPRAAEWTHRGIQLAERASDDRVRRWLIALHNNLGWTFHEAGAYPDALTEFEQAADAAEQFGSVDQRQIAQWSIARCLRSLGRVDEARAIQLTLLDLRPDDPYVREELDALAAPES